ncbi:MAG: glycosyltransferase family 39 protein [Isosphaerales bacterium]
MVDPRETPTVPEPTHGGRQPPWWCNVRALHLASIVLVAAGLRLSSLDSTSLWYDEVVTMRVARAASPTALLSRLDQIDGTRAPLHPLVLQAWLRVIGASDLAGRSFSALCGLLTLVVIYRLGCQTFDQATARWAAWLAAVCPPLVYYAREARMYAWLTLLTCISWLVFISFRRGAKPAHCLVYWLLLTSLVYSHPLGLFMVAAHGLAFVLVRSSLKLSVRAWLLIQLAVILAITPWLGRYMDHGTDYPMPRYSIRFLLAVPIEYVGGNAIVLVICMAIIAIGLLSWRPIGLERRPAIAGATENLILITWTATPPVLMYLYSYLFQPIFGPPRYHLFIAPAYLILLAHGLSKLPRIVRWPAAAGGLVVSLSLIRADVYSQVVKADWRGLAGWLSRQEQSTDAPGPRQPITVVIHPSDPHFRREQLEAARYYLSPRFRVVVIGDSAEPAATEPATTYDIDCLTKPNRQPDPKVKAFYGIAARKRSPSSYN